MKRTIALTLLVAMVATACGGTDAGSDSDDKPTITLIVNPWTASRLNAEVAKVIIENELGYPVRITEVNENDAMFTGMADGTLDAVLEIWPSGVTDAENAYFTDGSVVNIGLLGTIGKIGWFVPSYVIDANPALATWEGYDDPGVAEMFATAETGSLGRFLGTDPSYSQYDEQIIENLGSSVPGRVLRIRAGDRRRTRCPVRPPGADHHVLVDADCGSLEVRPGECAASGIHDACGASAAAEDGGVDCDYPEDVLFKAASAQLETRRRTCSRSWRHSHSPPTIS
jgi:glycine betaine/proline transport system substrate-binding protein